MVCALSQGGLEAKLLQSRSQIIIENALGMHEGCGLFAKKALEACALRLDLTVKFLA